MAYNPQNPNGQATMANSAPVVIASDQSNVPVTISQQDSFGHIVQAQRYNQIEVDYSTTIPTGATGDVVVTTANGGSAASSGGQGVFSSGTNANGGVNVVTNLSLDYRPHAELYAAFTAIFTTGVANSYQRIGVYNIANGFFIGYEGTAFGLTIRKNTSDTFVPKASWNVDQLTGAIGSKFTLNGTPVAYDSTKDNLFRIRFGWLGAATIYFEIYSPDGVWVLFHAYKVANQSTSPTIDNPNLPLTLDIQKTSGATDVVMKSACWGAGSNSPYNKITATITRNTLAQLTRTVIVGEKPGGGGLFENVKVNPSGSLITATTLDAGTATIGSIDNISGTISLPTGAATAAKQPALGTAGTASADVISVQGIAGMTALKVDGSAVTQPVSGTVTVTQSTATSLKTQAECYQGGSAVSSSNPLNVTLIGATSGGLTPKRVSATTPLDISSGGVTPVAGQVYGWYIYNPNTTVAYVQFFNSLASGATLGTNVIFSIGIPGLSAANVFNTIGIPFSTSISVGAATAANGNSAVSTAVEINIFYK